MSPKKQIPGPETPPTESPLELADTFGGPETFTAPPGLIENPSAQELAQRSGQVRKPR
jgi:hypothetical protein